MLQVLVGNGVLLTYSVGQVSCDIGRISIDKTICNKVTFEEEVFDSEF